MKRMTVLAVFLTAGCTARETAPSPRRVRVRVTTETGFEARHRSALEIILGEPSRTLGEMMRDAVGAELADRGIKVLPDGEPGAEAELEISLGAWNLENVPSANVATVAFTLVLRRDGDPEASWTFAMPRRTVTLRPGEARDFPAFIGRLAREALRTWP
ncbi:MAG: hypothetical protein K8T20_19515 [Planctomycetes bacterium]|nr:hypothetical protein [Planctomycetota bacterium]